MHSKNQAFFDAPSSRLYGGRPRSPECKPRSFGAPVQVIPRATPLETESPLVVLTAPTFPHSRALGTKIYDIWILLMHIPLAKLDRCTTHDATIPFPGVRTIMTQTPEPSSVDRALLIIYSSSGLCHIFSAVPLTFDIHDCDALPDIPPVSYSLPRRRSRSCSCGFHLAAQAQAQVMALQRPCFNLTQIVSCTRNYVLSIHLPTSRPETGIRTSLEPFTSASNSISLHDECGQKKDIVNFVGFVVYSDKNMRRWQEEDK